ncbi:MAG: DUF748 domain-containing protein [Methylococcales bacterium]|nr:DUF748 domain-containing protein [Methylococcales bacterium]
MATHHRFNYFKKPLVLSFLFIAIYFVVSLFVLPPFLKSKLPDIIQQETGRTAVISAVNFQPLALIITLEGVQIQELNQQTWLAFDELSVQIGLLASIKQQALVLNALVLKKPVINVVRNKGGAYNFHDLLKSSPKKSPEDQGSFPFSISQLNISDGVVNWTDAVADKLVSAVISPINIQVQNLGNVGDQPGVLDASLALQSGGTLVLKSHFNIPALSSEGHISLNKVPLNTLVMLAGADTLPVELNGDEILETDYVFNKVKQSSSFQIKNAALKLNNIDVLDKANDKHLISIPVLAVEGVGINFKQKTVSIKSATANDGMLIAGLEADGRLNYASLWTEKSDSKQGQVVEPIDPVNSADVSKEKPWDIKVGSFELINFGLDFEDKTLKTPVKVNLKPINFKLSDYSNIEPIRTPVQMSVGVNNGGSVKFQGHTVAEPFSAEVDVKIENIDLERFQSYYEKFVHLDVIDGALHLDGKLAFAKLEQDNPDIQFTGNLAVSSFLTRDQVLNKDFVKWENMALTDLVVDYLGNNYSAKSLTFDKPYLRVAIRKDKTANFNDILVVDSKESVSKAKSIESNKVALDPQKPAFKLGRVQIKEGTSDFSDQSLILPFEAQIQSLDGGASGISSEQNSLIKVNLKGSAYDLAPVDINGEVSPFLESYQAKVNFKGLPMPLVTPYMVQFSGYKVEKGKMTLGLNYKVVNSDLTATNNLLIDQFELGEQVENPNAVSLPIKLAVALLKDAQGRIKIDVPISGSLDDPQFSFGGVVADALFNGLSSLVSSPFNTLSMLMGNEKDLNLVSFTAGSSTLNDLQKHKLLDLAKALKARPNLNIEIKGVALQTKDWPLIRQDALYEQLKRIRAAELNKNAKKRIRDEYVQLSDEDYKRLLADLFIEKFPHLAKRSVWGEPRLLESNAGDFYAVAKEKLLTLIKPEPERLKVLATARAQGIANFLVQQGGIAAENIYILDTLVDLDTTDKEIVSLLLLNAD